MATEICWSFESYIPRVCLFVTVLAYVLFGNNIDAEKIYLVTAYYNVLRTTLYRSFPLGKHSFSIYLCTGRSTLNNLRFSYCIMLIF